MKKILTIIIIVVAMQLGAVSIASASGGGSYHKVHYGETLYSIARHYQVSPYRIAEVNGLYDLNYIYAGQVLYIPAGYGYDPGPGDGYDGGTYHKVRYGETLYSIGRKYNASPHHIAKVNGLYNPNYIYAGQVLYIPAGSQYPGYGHGYKHHKGSQYDSGYGYGHGYNYGYDYTGYYYSHGQQRYSYTCGYYYNCW